MKLCLFIPLAVVLLPNFMDCLLLHDIFLFLRIESNIKVLTLMEMEGDK